MQIYFYEVGFQWDKNAIFLGVVGLMPRAQWLFGRRGTVKDRTRDGFNGANGRVDLGLFGCGLSGLAEEGEDDLDFVGEAFACTPLTFGDVA